MLEKYSAKTIGEAKEMSIPFPIGLVPAYIQGVEETVSKKGNEMLVVTFRSYESAAEIKYYIVDDDYAPRKLKSLEKAFDIPFGSGEKSFLGRKGVVRTVEDYYNGYKTAKIAGFAPFDPNVKYESRPIENGDGGESKRTTDAPAQYTDVVPF